MHVEMSQRIEEDPKSFMGRWLIDQNSSHIDQKRFGQKYGGPKVFKEKANAALGQREISNILQEHIQNRTLEQTMDGLMPPLIKKIGDGMQNTTQERVQTRMAEQTVAISDSDDSEKSYRCHASDDASDQSNSGDEASASDVDNRKPRCQ